MFIYSNRTHTTHMEWMECTSLAVVSNKATLCTCALPFHCKKLLYSSDQNSFRYCCCVCLLVLLLVLPFFLLSFEFEVASSPRSVRAFTWFLVKVKRIPKTFNFFFYYPSIYSAPIMAFFQNSFFAGRKFCLEWVALSSANNACRRSEIENCCIQHSIKWIQKSNQFDLWRFIKCDRFNFLSRWDIIAFIINIENGAAARDNLLHITRSLIALITLMYALKILWWLNERQ